MVVVIECKADPTKHESPNKNKYADYAVDGALHYGDYLSKEKDVLCIGVSGQNDSEMKVSHYLKLRDQKQPEAVHGNEILSFYSYLNKYRDKRYRVDYDNLLKFAKQLNELLHKNKIPENERAIVFSGILLALEDDTFIKTYSAYSDALELSKHLIDRIKVKLANANLQEGRAFEMEQAFRFITSHTALIDEGFLVELVRLIHNEIRPFIKTENYFQIISELYKEFLKYANNDAALGIVLTPAHITDLFCELAEITADSVVIDACCGTGGFLIAAMKRMISLANGNIDKKIEIKSKQLLGIEYAGHIYTLCAANMIIHGDGKTNIRKGDCFKEIEHMKQYKPTVALLNPPYNDTTGIDELKFVQASLDGLQKNGTLVVILPMRCALYQKGAGASIKENILKNHTLDAVMSMPTDLFYPVGVVTCIMVFKAHIPHNLKKKTWFGYWKDDGFIKVKHKGRVDANEQWRTIKTSWLESYFNRDVKAGESVTYGVTANDEWCAEAYMETDYLKITQADFEKTVRDYAIFKQMNK